MVDKLNGIEAKFKEGVVMTVNEMKELVAIIDANGELGMLFLPRLQKHGEE